MVIPSAIVAHVVVVSAVMPAAIAVIVVGLWKVEVVWVGVSDVNSEISLPAVHVDRAEEMDSVHEAGILLAAQYPAQVIVAYVQIVIIAV